ncbi:MAG: acetate kinase [Acidobacteria bacterium]|nr:acetate kinase [Acidobacteriota bacterium]
MKVLTLNCGSSTVKYKLIDTESRSNIATGKVERIGMIGASIELKSPDGNKVVREVEILDHVMAINAILKIMVEPKVGVLKDLEEIDAVGHRVVHGGETFSGSVLITDKVVQTLKDNIQLAPLHNPPNIQGIEAAMALLDVPMVGVFDTAFHSTIPEYSYIYPIPYQLYKKYAIRRYGFHGTSHRFVSQRACEINGRNFKNCTMISIHLGNGASMAAIRNGKSVDTSMGFTPLEGLVMGTRCGDIDPAIILHIMRQEKLSLHEADNLLNKFSGILGISGRSSDMRDIEELYFAGDKQAHLVINIYAYRIKKYIGSYFAVLNGVECIVFTAGIGENSPLIREKCLEGLDHLGIVLDKKKNDEVVGQEAIISTPDSPTKIMVVPTNEELVIALDTAEIVSRMKK